MSVMRQLCLITLMVLFAGSCSVISRHVRIESEPAVPFKTLVQKADKYAGKTVILGGYILETKNLEDETIIEVLQAPLAFGDEPTSEVHSEGRIIVTHKGFLEPQLYSKERKITVAGTLTDCVVEKVKTCKIESREIYIWPKYEYVYQPLYYYPGGYFYRHGYHHRSHYPHRNHGFW